MSLFDNIPGRKRSKVRLPKNAKLADAEAADVAQPIEPEPEFDADTLVEPKPEAEPATESAATPEPEAAPPVHEKVEGIDDIADVVVPGAVVAGAAAAGGVFKPKKPKRSVGLPKKKVKEPKAPKEPREPKRRRAHVTQTSQVVGLGGTRRAVKAREQKVATDAPDAAPKQPRQRRRVALLEGFRDPVRRPRYILWSGAAVFVLAAVMIVALGVTSTRWFCSEGCHKVQDDTIIAYEHSSHREISCMACHMPVGASPIVFILHKAEALGELYLTVTNDYELPLNGESEVALTMASTQCTQCHDTENRKITPSVGIVIDHKVHAENEVQCPMCHNRIAHNEDFDLTLTDPASGKPNTKHANFTSMTACFRCHTQNSKAPGPLKAPGECSACHPAGFELKPASHLEPEFFPKGHGELGAEAASEVESATAEAKAEGEEGGEEHEDLGMQLPSVESINECSTCHSEKFCSDCHGLPMPHPSDFKKNHGATGKKNPQACEQCHGSADTFCDECHHKTSIKRKYDESRPWFAQHPDAVADVGATDCFRCHEPTYCARCHVKGTSGQ